MGRNVFGDHRASTNHGPRPNGTLRNHGGTDSDHSALPNGDITAQMNPRSDVGMAPDVVVVIHGAAGVENNVITDDRARVDHYTSADHHSFAQVRIRNDYASQPNDSGELPIPRASLALFP